MDINEIPGIIDYSRLRDTTPECPQIIKDYIRDSVNQGQLPIDLVPRLVAFPKDTFPWYRKNWTKYYGLKYFEINGEMWGLYRGPVEQPQPPAPTPEIQPTPAPALDPESE